MSNHNLTAELKNKISKIKLIALDLDGTTLTDDKKIPPEVTAAIKKAKDKGYEITFLTGRMFAAAAPYLKSMNLSVPIVCMNGTLIAESHTGKVLYEKTLEIGCVKQALKAVDGAPVYQFIYNGDKIHHSVKDPEILKYLEWWAVNFNEVEEINIDDYENIYQLLFIGELEILNEISKNIDSDSECNLNTFSFPSPRYPLHFLEVKTQGDSKGKGLKFLRNYFGVNKEEVLAVGDYLNDFELLKEAGVAVAVANAVDDLKNNADIVTNRTNNEGAVEEVIDLILEYAHNSPTEKE